MSSMVGDPTIQTRIDVAEIKGMLTAVVGAHSERLTAHDTRLDSHELRLNEKAKTIARHDERLNDLEEDSSARSGKFFGTAGLVVSVVAVVFTLLDKIA